MKIIIVGNFARWLVKFRGSLMSAMIEKGHEVHACAPNAPAEIKTALKKMGVIYWDIPLKRSSLNPLDDIKLFFSLSRLFRTIQPDLFFGYTIKPILIGSTAAWMAGIPRRYTMIEGLGYLFNDTRGGNFTSVLATFLYRICIAINHKVFFLNTADVTFFLDKKMLPRKVGIVLLNGIGVDLDEYQWTAPPKHISFLFASRLLLEKGILEYIHAARILKKKYPDIKFKVAGWIDDNPSSITVKDLQEWKDEGTIEYLGNLDTIQTALASSSVFILPSFYKEGLPRSILEAMSTGRPVITTDIPGCRDAVIQGETGLLVPVKQSEILAKAMEKFITDPQLIVKMGTKGRQLAENKFNSCQINRQILNAMEL